MDFDLLTLKLLELIFFECIREHLINKKLILADELFKTIFEIKYLLLKAQSELHEFYFEKKKNCSCLYLFPIYQDGVSHAIDYLLFKSKTGESYNPLFIINQMRLL